jgi:Rrf2 family protein
MRAMLDLARHYHDGLVLVKDTARREGISERYLEHLFLSLKTAGLVKSLRGAHGGFTLSRPPSEIKLIEVMQACEGSLVLVECVADASVCPRSSQCVARDIWRELKRAMDGVLSSLTLQDLIERQPAKEHRHAAMYHI